MITEETVGISGIQTRVVGIEGEHADHLTTTTAHTFDPLSLSQVPNNLSTFYLRRKLSMTKVILLGQEVDKIDWAEPENEVDEDIMATVNADSHKLHLTRAAVAEVGGAGK